MTRSEAWALATLLVLLAVQARTLTLLARVDRACTSARFVTGATTTATASPAPTASRAQRERAWATQAAVLEAAGGGVYR